VVEHRKISQLVGDAAREVAILWAALYPLEAHMTRNFRWNYCIWTYVAVVVLMIFGIALEGRNRNERPSTETSRFRILLDRMSRWFVFSKAGTKAGGASGPTETGGATKPMDK
jgi:hypothetical protein